MTGEIEPGKQSVYDKIQAIFRQAQEPDSNIEIIVEGGCEIIEGVQQNGYPISIVRPTLEQEFTTSMLLQVSMTVPIVTTNPLTGESITDPEFALDKHYRMGYTDEGILKTHMILNSPSQHVVPGDGEMADVARAIDESDFSSHKEGDITTGS